MRRFLVWLSWLLLLTVLAFAVLLYAILDRAPLVRRGEAISPEAVAQAKTLFRANDPRGLRSGEERTVVVPLSLLDEGVNHLASRGLHGRGAFVLNDEAGEIRVSLPVPGLAGALHLNLRAAIASSTNGLRIMRASIGSLPLPPTLVQAAIEQAMCKAGYCREWSMALAAIRKVSMEPASNTIVLTYVWAAEILDRARSVALPPEDVARLREAHEKLAALLQQRPASAKLPLVAVLKPMLAASGADRRERRRAALLVLAAYLGEKDISAAIPTARGWPRLRPLELTLRSRHDTAQHFIISAALAAWSGEPVAEAIGMYKELDDARQGSGFSFADLAADRAGQRFGEVLAKNTERLDDALQGPFAEVELMPDQSGLPEYLHEPEFRQRYGGPESAAFQRVSEEIARRLDKLALYRQ